MATANKKCMQTRDQHRSIVSKVNRIIKFEWRYNLQYFSKFSLFRSVYFLELLFLNFLWIMFKMLKRSSVHYQNKSFDNSYNEIQFFRGALLHLEESIPSRRRQATQFKNIVENEFISWNSIKIMISIVFLRIFNRLDKIVWIF